VRRLSAAALATHCRRYPRSLLAPPALTDAAAAAWAAASGPHRDAAAAAVTAVGAYALVKAAAVAAGRGWADQVRETRGWVGAGGGFFRRPLTQTTALPSPPPSQKLTRKLVHTLAGPGYTLCWPLFR